MKKMALTPIDSAIYLSEMSRTRYSDVGLVNVPYALKFQLYNTSRDIINSVKEYVSRVSDEDTKILVMVDVVPGNFFWLDSMYFKYFIKDKGVVNTLEIMVDLKRSLEYSLLSSLLVEDKNIISAYVNYWRKCLLYVGNRVGVDLLASEV